MGPKHAFADQFTNRWAWRFEKTLAAAARTAQTAEGLQRWINVSAAEMARRGGPERANSWLAFVDRKLAGLPWPARPEQVAAITTSRATHVIRAVGGPRRPGQRAGPAAAAPPPPAVYYRGDTGERVHGVEAAPYLRRAGPGFDATRPVGRPAPGGPQVHVIERQRAPGGPVPPGWETAHVGRWYGRDAEVVYNPRRHQVMITHQLGRDMVAALEGDGWERYATDGGRVAWIRGRLAATRTALARADQATGIDAAGPGRAAALTAAGRGLEL